MKGFIFLTPRMRNEAVADEYRDWTGHQTTQCQRRVEA